MADFPKYDSGEPTAWSFREYDESDGSPVNWTKTADSHAHIATLKREWDEENGARYVEIELPSDKQVGGEEGRDQCPSHVDGKNCPRPFGDIRDHIGHAEKGDQPVGVDLLCRQCSDGNIDVTPEESQDQQGEHVPSADAELFVGILKNPHLDQEEQKYKNKREDDQKRKRDREIVQSSYLRFLIEAARMPRSGERG